MLYMSSTFQKITNAKFPITNFNSLFFVNYNEMEFLKCQSPKPKKCKHLPIGHSENTFCVYPPDSRLNAINETCKMLENPKYLQNYYNEHRH